ncbi:MAG: ABC transporter ATP-binding protein [Lachnospiraceae bacterium]|nr:ABC transporter ATP-binding protein [Lachnospiraceae bacterium]
MLQIYKKMMVLLDKKQKRTMVGIVFMMLIGAILEALGISVIVPIVQIVMDEQALNKPGLVRTIYDFLGMESQKQFTLVILGALAAIFAIKNIYLYIQQKVLCHFVYTNQFRTSERMMKNYLHKDYEFFLNADTAVVQRTITSDVNNMYALILNSLQLVSEIIVFAIIAVVLIVSDWQMTLVISGMLGVTLLLITKAIKPVMRKAGEDNQEYYSGLFKLISQTVMGIKEVKITAREQHFVDEYVKCGRGYVDAVQKYTLLTSIPRLLIETVCISGTVVYMMVLIAMGTPLSDLVTTLTVFAAAVVRLMPCATRINTYLNNISYFEPFLMGVSDNLQDEINHPDLKREFAKDDQKKMPLHKAITLKDITYAYPNSDKLIFEHADMEIPIGKAVGIVGTTGAGKSTVVDILLGLLNMQGGTVYADDADIRSDYYGWLKNVGYIPQMIFMLDDTIRRNVAFGVPDELISEERVWEVLKEAQLDEFIKTLPEGLDTSIGERGIRLSGGQRQRIGIARSLYNDPDVLIMDEATSALDNDTEAAIIESINRLHGKKTLVIIAHRLQTIENCDMIYRVENGKVLRER